MLPIRALIPNLESLATDASSKAYLEFIRGAVRATFYYIYEKFNVSEVEMSVTARHLGLSRGHEVLVDLGRGVADTSLYSMVPSLLHPNVTAAGILADYIQCKLITFPELRLQTEESTAWNFLLLTFFGGPAAILFSFSLLIHILWYWKEDKNFFPIAWEILKVSYRQIFSRPKTSPIRIAIISLSVGFTIYQAIIVALINTDKISIASFTQIKTLNDAYDHNFLPILAKYASCSQLISSQPSHIQSFLGQDTSQMLKRKESLTSIDEIVLSSLSTGSYLDKIVALRSSITWRNFLYKACSTQPESLIKHPPYLSPSIDIKEHPLIMSKSFSLKGQNSLKKYAATLREQGLQHKKGIFAETLATAADPTCMNSKLELEHQKHSPLEFAFVKPLLSLLLITAAMATILFSMENIELDIF